MKTNTHRRLGVRDPTTLLISFSQWPKINALIYHLLENLREADKLQKAWAGYKMALFQQIDKLTL